MKAACVLDGMWDPVRPYVKLQSGYLRTWYPRCGPRRTRGDSLPAAVSPSIWWKCEQKSTDDVVAPTITEAAAAAAVTAA